MSRGKVYRFTQKAKLEDLIRLVLENDMSNRELEEISSDMVRFGDRAVEPLLNSLEGLNDEDAFYRIAYVIECLQNYTFVPPLLKMVFKKHLPPSHRAQILNVLSSLDVDISDTLLGRVSGDLKDMTESFVDLTLKDENLLESFLEEFQYLGYEYQLKVIRRISSIRSPRSVFILFLLASQKRSPVAIFAARSLGRIRDGMARSALRRIILRFPDQDLKGQAIRSLRRLDLLGVKRQRRFYTFPAGPLYRVIVSRVDGVGEFAVTFSRFYDEKRRSLAMSVFQLNESIGIVECYGHFKTSRKSFDNNVAGLIKARLSFDVPFDYGITLLKHGIHKTEEGEGVYPAEMSLREQLLSPSCFVPSGHTFGVKGFDYDDVRDDLALLEKSSHLVTLPECSDWLLSSKSTFELAEQLLEEGAVDDDPFGDHRRRRRLNEYIQETIQPLEETLKQRLLFTAELMQKGKRQKKYVKMALCAALNLGKSGNVHLQYHPFIQVLAKESIREAADYLKEGGDYRGFFDEYGEDD